MVTELLSYLLYGVSVARYKEYTGPLGHQLLRYGSSQPAARTSNHQRFALETEHYPACLLTKDDDCKTLIVPSYSTRCRSRPFRRTYRSTPDLRTAVLWDFDREGSLATAQKEEQQD